MAKALTMLFDHRLTEDLCGLFWGLVMVNKISIGTWEEQRTVLQILLLLFARNPRMLFDHKNLHAQRAPKHLGCHKFSVFLIYYSSVKPGEHGQTESTCSKSGFGPNLSGFET